MPPGVPRAGASQGREGTKTEPCPCARAVPTHHIWGPASRSTTALRERARVRGATGAPQNPSCCRETPLSHLSPTWCWHYRTLTPSLPSQAALCNLGHPLGVAGPHLRSPSPRGEAVTGGCSTLGAPVAGQAAGGGCSTQGWPWAGLHPRRGTTLAPSPGASSSGATSLPPALLSALGGRRHGDSLHAGLRCGREAGTPWSWSSQGCGLCSHRSPTHRPQIPA